MNRLEQFLAFRRIRRTIDEQVLVEPAINALREYAQADFRPSSSDSTSVTNGEVALILQPQATVIEDALRLHANASSAADESAASSVALSIARANVRNKKDETVPREEESEAEQTLKDLRTELDAILEIRRTLLGQLELKQLVSKKMGWIVSTLVLVADVLTLWAALNDLTGASIQDQPVFQSGRFSGELHGWGYRLAVIDALIPWLVNLIMSTFGGVIIILNAHILGRATAYRRAKAALIRIERTEEKDLPIPENLWDRIKTPLINWYSTGWSVVVLLSLSLLLFTAVIYYNIVGLRFSGFFGTSQDVPDFLGWVALSFLILPVTAAILSIASNNLLTEIVDEAIARESEARRALVVARERRLRQEQNLRVQVQDLERTAISLEADQKVAERRFRDGIAAGEVQLQYLRSAMVQRTLATISMVRSLVAARENLHVDPPISPSLAAFAINKPESDLISKLELDLHRTDRGV